MAPKARRKRPQLETLDLDLHPNEASDLLSLEHEPVLSSHGWDMAFWTVLDDGPIEDCMAVIGHRRGTGHDKGSWEIVRPRFKVNGNAGKTEDAEACVRRDGWIYVLGSQYGSKDGPLEKKRAFVARFREDQLGGDLGKAQAELDIALNRFGLHRAVNDALKAFGPRVVEIGDRARKGFVKKARKKAGKKLKLRFEKTDVPINVEGAAVTGEGALLIGLRFPVTADGHPILAEVAGFDRIFEDERATPVVRRFWVVENVGTKRKPAGIRAMHRQGDELHLITGNLESQDEDAVLIADHPEAVKATCAHHVVRLPKSRDGGEVSAELLHDFGLPNVEGLATDSRKRFFYVTDEDDRVHMRYIRERTSGGSGGARGRSSGGSSRRGARSSSSRSSGGSSSAASRSGSSAASRSSASRSSSGRSSGSAAGGGPSGRRKSGKSKRS